MSKVSSLTVALQAPRHMQASKVPSTRIGRLFHYGGEISGVRFARSSSSPPAGLAAGMSLGAASEALRRATSGGVSGAAESSIFMSEANVRRLVDKLSRMRGAALKLGQFLSIQGALLSRCVG